MKSSGFGKAMWSAIISRSLTKNMIYDHSRSWSPKSQKYDLKSIMIVIWSEMIGDHDDLDLALVEVSLVKLAKYPPPNQDWHLTLIWFLHHHISSTSFTWWPGRQLNYKKNQTILFLLSILQTQLTQMVFLEGKIPQGSYTMHFSKRRKNSFTKCK